MAWMYPYLMITLAQIHLGRKGNPDQTVNNILNSWDGICIDICGFFEHVVVSAYPKCTLLTKEQKRCSKSTR